MTNFNARSFWNTRHSRNFGPESVGYAGLGVPYNKWMYRVRERVLTHQLQKQNISVKGKDVLDIGSGTGFYIRIWDEFGARSVTGSAFAPFAVNELNNKFSQHRFVNLDISGDVPPELGLFDIVSAFDVLYHIVDDGPYQKAIANIGSLVRTGGYFVFSENVTLKRETLPHQVSRTEEEIRALLTKNGFIPVLRVPVFFIMNRPLKSSNQVLKLSWKIIAGTLYRLPKAGELIGFILYPIELACLHFVKRGPTTEMFIYKKIS